MGVEIPIGKHVLRRWWVSVSVGGICLSTSKICLSSQGQRLAWGATTCLTPLVQPKNQHHRLKTHDIPGHENALILTFGSQKPTQNTPYQQHPSEGRCIGWRRRKRSGLKKDQSSPPASPVVNLPRRVSERNAKKRENRRYRCTYERWISWWPIFGVFCPWLPSFLLLSASVTKICSQKRFGSKKTVSTLISWTRWPFLPGISVCLRDVWKVETPINSWRDR